MKHVALMHTIKNCVEILFARSNCHELSDAKTSLGSLLYELPDCHHTYLKT